MQSKEVKEARFYSMTDGDIGIMNEKGIEDASFSGLPSDTRPPEERAADIVSQMTFSEQISFCSGYENLGIKKIERLGLPSVWCSDASAGVRCFGKATAFPSPIAMAASWNRNLIKACSWAIGEEARAKGISILLGPGVNIYRVPTCGRNFEYMGEDPYLASELVVPYIEGVQEKGVIATIKHFACNNSDYDRKRMNSIVDERTLREIYLPAFKAAVQKAKTGALMTAYNPVNGDYSSENKYLLCDILRKEWGFDGFVMSDWWSTYSAEGIISAGLDLEMPLDKWINEKEVNLALKKGTIKKEQIAIMVKNILTVLFRFGIYDRSPIDTSFKEYSPEHSQIAFETACDGATLLKNEKILPLDRTKIKKIAVLGPLAQNTPVGGGGSSFVSTPSEKFDILSGIKELSLATNKKIETVFVESKEGIISPDAIETVKTADVVILCVGYTGVEESEFYEKPWNLPYNQDKLIIEAGKINPNSVVVLTSGTGCETESWLPSTKGLLHCYYLGQAVGHAVASLLFGEKNPSGKLPFTMAKKWEDFRSVQNYVPKEDVDKTNNSQMDGPEMVLEIAKKEWLDVEYKEKLLVGYRQFDTEKITPQFSFGFGLSYTSFELSNPELSLETINAGEELTASVTVSNTGEFLGAEVVQLYIKDQKSSLPRPEKELKGFSKISLSPGESKKVSITLNKEAFGFYNDQLKSWSIEEGLFTIFFGTSSREISFKKDLSIKGNLQYL